MPRVRMLTSVAEKAWSLDYDHEYDLPAEQAKAYLAQGIAELVEPEQPQTPERRRRVRMETR